MANGKAHRKTGLIVGTVAGAIAALDEDGAAFLAEVAGGALGGKFGGMMPDVLDPPTSPNHRGLAHGIIPAGALFTWAMAELPGWQAELRNRATHHAVAFRRTGDIQEFMMEMMLHALSGFLAGLIGGYASHLLMDARTPKGLPVVA